MAAHNELGKQGEALAAEFLEALGYHILDRNYRFERAEIDIVALQLAPAELAFVEVKARTQPHAGDHAAPEDAVTPAKQRLIFRAADAYLYEKHLQTVPVRFDIIAVDFSLPGHPRIRHLQDAFRMDGASWT